MPTLTLPPPSPCPTALHPVYQSDQAPALRPVAPGHELTEIEFTFHGTDVLLGVGFDGQSLLLPPQMPFQQWQNALAAWRQIGQAYHFGLADLLSYGVTEYGRARVDDSLAQMEFDLADANKAFAIASFSPGQRRVGLSSEHYFVISRQPGLSERQRTRWLDNAVKHKLTALNLRRSIEAGKVLTPEEMDERSGRNSGIPNIYAARFQFDLWKRAIETNHPISDWGAEEAQAWLTVMEPVLTLAEAVRARL